jgi:hypothetical protein
LDQLLIKYSDCEDQTRLLLDDFSKYLVQPMRVCILYLSLVPLLPITSLYLFTQEVITDSKQSLTKTTAKNNIEGELNLQQRIEHTTTILPYHSHLFEKHRVKYMKTALQNMILNEIAYHCHVVEKLTPLLESLSNIEEISVLGEMES